MNKYSYLVKNIGLLTIASLVFKLVNIFMIPIYTRVLSSLEFGTIDIINTTVLLLVPILTLNLHESVLRFSLEKKFINQNLIVISVKYYFFGLIVLTLLVLVNQKFEIIKFISDYPTLFILLYIFSALGSIMTSYARGINRVSDVAVSGIVSAMTIVLINILFLIVLNLGFSGYLAALLIGTSTQSIYLIIKTKVWKDINFKKVDKNLEKIMLLYSIPLIINSISWWINNLSDRFIVIFYLGLSENGIYSLSYKIPSILTLFTVIFNQSWVISAVKEFDKKDKQLFFSNTYNFYNAIMVIFSSLLIVFNQLIAFILFKNEFYIAWKYVPFLLISVVFGALSGYLGGIFSATNKTNVAANIVIIGALLNFILNIVLINLIGTIGVAISTMISYATIWSLRMIFINKLIRLKILITRDLISYLILFLQSVSYFVIDSLVFLYLIQTFLFFIVIILYVDVWNKYLIKIKEKLFIN